MSPVDILRKKRDGEKLSPVEIACFIRGATDRTWPDYQISALLMAICIRGMDGEETAQLTRAMVESGVKLDFSDLPGPAVDKHSTGGVGDKTSLILAPLAAACGVYVPMMSGRGLGHTGGTLDKLEAIPGFRVHLSLDEFKSVVGDVGCALVGPTREIAPADKILYALRDVTATVENLSLITASILSKKLAEGISALVMDVKCGRGAFMKSRRDARALAESLVENGNANHVRTEALITRMDAPLGRAIGNSLEVRESIEALRGEHRSEIVDLAVELAARMVFLGRLSDTLDDARRRVAKALYSGAGLEKFRQVIDRQGGDPRVIEDLRRLPEAPKRHRLKAQGHGYVHAIDSEGLGQACMTLGAGRRRVEDAIDPAVGAVVEVKVGDLVREGQTLAEVHYRDEESLTLALARFSAVFRLSETLTIPEPIVMEAID